MCKDGHYHNPRIANELSSVLHEMGVYNLESADNRKVYNALTINGLSGALTHRPGEALKLRPEVMKYGELIQAMNSVKLPDAPNGFQNKLDEIVANKKEHKPLRVIEYKAIPQVFLDNKKLKIEEYLAYIDLVKKSREAKWDSAKFLEEFNRSGLKSAIDTKNTYDVNDVQAEEKLTAAVRKGFIVCLNPHALDSDGILREDKKLEIYRLLADFTRAPETIAWARKYVKEKHNLDLPEGTSLFSINNRSVDHIEFSGPKPINKLTNHIYENLDELIKDLDKNGPSPKNKNLIFIDVKENHPQPYVEIAPNTSKDEVLPSSELVTKDNLLVIGAGDSRGTDAGALGQSLLLGGFAYIVRGLMGPSDLANKMVELLSQAQNSHHPYALKNIDNKNYQLITAVEGIEAGAVKSKDEWAKLLETKYSSRIFHADNIHQMNAMNAAIFSEFFKGNKEFDLKLDENLPWVKDALAMNNKADLATPDCGTQEALKNEIYETPFLAKFFKIENMGPVMRKALGAISYVMQGAGIAGIAAKLLGQNRLVQIAKSAQRISLGLNNVISGVSRGLIAPAVRYPWQFIGEMIGLASTFFDKASSAGQTLRALSNVTLIGRGNELIMRENTNLDDFKDKAEADKVFGEQRGLQDIKKDASKLTKDRMRTADGIETLFGANWLRKNAGTPGRLVADCIRFCSEAVADLLQGGRMLIQTITVPAFAQNMISNFFGLKGKGLTRLSKNSGRPYSSPFSPAHQYATLGFATAATSIFGSLVGRAHKGLGQALASLANMIPTLGIVTTGKHVMQDAAGDPRRFTTVTGKQESYSPEKAGFKQIIGGWIQAAAASVLHTDIGQLLFDVGTGTYLHGINDELKVRNDDSAVNKKSRAGEYFQYNNYMAPNRSGDIGATTVSLHKPNNEMSFAA